MLRSLVGSEMCIRDRPRTPLVGRQHLFSDVGRASRTPPRSSRQGGSRRVSASPPGNAQTYSPHRAPRRSWRSSSGAYHPSGRHRTCLLYTSDAADEEDSVDLGGRRIIKKKKKEE
eukprot:TRINITY_DN37422_c0_g1_i1.p1 TRINITY_DN37422_c0_g1~~TRINITY_DN37422_c0_g1_i1.p1  ORF type:complete len:116 (-),score=18.93 TRINITY_DN37422_c0_g1_i1:77-424(-)